jgi:hypothetical protein
VATLAIAIIIKKNAEIITMSAVVRLTDIIDFLIDYTAKIANPNQTAKKNN